MVQEKTLESPSDCKEIKPVNPKGNEFGMLIGRTDDGYEAPIVCSPVAKSWLVEKDPDTGKDWGQEEKWEVEDKVVGWPHLLSGPKCEQTPGDSEEQGRLACCSPWGHKESDSWVNNRLILCWQCSCQSLGVSSWVSDVYLWKDLCSHFTWKSQKDGEFLAVNFRAGQEDRPAVGRVIICIIYQDKMS